ncbi:hypothetical protein Peur_027624 [Populus x canadensis]
MSGPRAAHAKRPATGEIQNGFLPSSLSSPAATTPLPAKQQKRSKQVCCSFSFFVFSPASLPSDLPNLEPGVARAANRPGVWMAGSATSLLPFHFCHGGVVHRCHGCEIGAHPSFGFLPLLHYPLASLLISSLSL